MEEHRARPVQRFVGIEGMRAVAACSILVFHCSQLFTASGGAAFGDLAYLLKPLWLGVTAFFVLSGFLLYRPFAASIIEGTNAPSVRRYLRHRAYRILPAYWVVLTLTAFVLGTAVIDAAPTVTGGMSDHLGLFTLDALLLQGYHPSTLGSGIMPAWSLSAEAAFYLLLPVIAVGAARAAQRTTSHRQRVVIALCPVAVLELIGLFGHGLDTWVLPGPIGSFAYGWHSVIDRGFLGQADGFAWGMAVAVLLAEAKAGRRVCIKREHRLTVEVALVALALGTLLTARDLSTMLFPAPFAVILAYVALNQHRHDDVRLIRVLSSRPFVAVGLASYSVFLWNVPIYLLMGRYGLVFTGYAGFPLTLAVLGTVTGVCAFLTYRYVEVPAIRHARRRRVADAMVQAPVTAPAPSASGD